MSETLYYAFVCVVMVAATSITRGTFFLLPSRWQLPPKIEHALRYAPACALTAIIIPSVLTDKQGHLVADLANPRLWAVLAGGVAYTLRKSMPLMICVGMAVFTAVRLWV